MVNTQFRREAGVFSTSSTTPGESSAWRVKEGKQNSLLNS